MWHKIKVTAVYACVLCCVHSPVRLTVNATLPFLNILQGGTSVWALMISPQAKVLFHRAIGMSSAFVSNISLDSAERDNLEFLRKTSCQDATCLRNLTTTQILQVRCTHSQTQDPHPSHSHHLSSISASKTPETSNQLQACCYSPCRVYRSDSNQS